MDTIDLSTILNEIRKSMIHHVDEKNGIIRIERNPRSLLAQALEKSKPKIRKLFRAV